MTLRIYLEAKAVAGLPFGHLYLVLRDDTLPRDQADEEAFVIRGGGDADGNLAIEAKLLKNSSDKYSEGGPVAELCRSFNRILCAKGERLWERNVQQNLDRKRSGLH